MVDRKPVNPFPCTACVCFILLILVVILVVQMRLAFTIVHCVDAYSNQLICYVVAVNLSPVFRFTNRERKYFGRISHFCAFNTFLKLNFVRSNNIFFPTFHAKREKEAFYM